MEAKVVYKNGWKLILPQTGNAPLLFMEWVSDFDSGKLPIQCINDKDDSFSIVLNLPKEGYEEVVEYINNNL